jgi:hypothetical protein
MGLCRYDLSKKCEEKYRDCTDCILDKIRAEIMSKDGLEEALEIIDKYRAESEVGE